MKQMFDRLVKMLCEVKCKGVERWEGRCIGRADFVHEMLHAICNNLGYREHDEKKIDELAQALYAVFVDNPEMFASTKNE